MKAPQYEFGGVNSNTNPVNRPTNRAILCRNWAPKPGGWLELRKGYTEVEQSEVTATPIHSIVSYKLWNGSRYALYIQGDSVKSVTLSDGSVFGVGTLGSSDKASFFKVRNQIFFDNGSALKFFDGAVFRSAGVRALTAAEVASVTLAEGVREATAGGCSGNAAGGSFSATTNLGYNIYVVYFDKSVNERGPARLLSASRIVFGSGTTNSFDCTSLENLTNTNWVKVFARTNDGSDPAHFCTTASVSVTQITRSGFTATVTATAHGRSVGDIVIISGNSEDFYNEMWCVASVPDANHFTVTLPAQFGNTGTGGTMTKVYQVSNSATVASITNIEVDTSLTANEERGLPASVLTGYQFYLSLEDSYTGHVGNRIQVGPRFKVSYRCNVRLNLMPDPTAIAATYRLKIGRTGDGAEVPYACADSAGNHAVTTGISYSLVEAQIDGEKEMPEFNDVPVAMDKFVVAGDHVYGNPDDSPYIYRSGSLLDDRAGKFHGRPEQSWASDDLETFPTNEAITCLAEHEQEVWAFTANDFAVLSEVSGQLAWQGPWPIGCAGKRAFVKTPYGPAWLTAEKQLATIADGGPVSISDEYEKALLSQIGDAYLSEVELTYLRSATRDIDHIKIKARNSAGTPFIVIHDFKLQGQGYDNYYQDALASDFTTAQVRDADGVMQVFAGGSDGRIYKLDEGLSDNGEEFAADYITLVNPGEDIPNLAYISLYGDSEMEVSGHNKLNTETADDFYPFAKQNDPGEDDNFHWRFSPNQGDLTGPFYLRLKLTSHSEASTDQDWNSTIHLPLEDYGRIYSASADLEDPRG